MGAISEAYVIFNKVGVGAVPYLVDMSCLLERVSIPGCTRVLPWWSVVCSMGTGSRGSAWGGVQQEKGFGICGV